MQCTWVFSTPYSTLLTINVPTQVEPCFVHKKQVVQHVNPFYHSCPTGFIFSDFITTESKLLK
jgi:hypothetical protein